MITNMFTHSAMYWIVTDTGSNIAHVVAGRLEKVQGQNVNNETGH